MRYRPEIDGLRALAVIPVILFHGGIELFRGGYVGVDVFFVISGYLITGLIHADLERGRFSLSNFYIRRARRILPALFVVVLACLPFAWAWMSPEQLADFAGSVAAVSLFSANLFFWLQQNYFQASAELKPLLHTWSLGVEEQFYFIFPLFLVFAWRHARRWLMPLIGVGFVASLALSDLSAQSTPAVNFYLLPTRAWELLIGAGLALSGGLIALRPPVANLLAAIGLAMVVAAVVTFDKSTPTPSYLTLLPTLGSAFVIGCARPDTVAGRILAWPPFVGLGLISYSAYLWHQPLFAFFRLYSPTAPTGWDITLLVLACLVLAGFTWVFVETPIRRGKTISRPQLVQAAVVGSTLLLAIGLGGYLAKGFPGRSPVFADWDQRLRPNYGLSPACEYVDRFFPRHECMTGAQPTLLLWGDSVAMQLASGLQAAHPELHFIQATRSACGPIFGIAQIESNYPISWARSCTGFNESIFEYLRAQPTIRQIVISSRFVWYVDPSARLLTPEGQVNADPSDMPRRLRDTVRRVEALGKKVWIVSPPPNNGKDLGRCLARASYFGRDLHSCDFPREEQARVQAPVIGLLKAVEALGASVTWLSDSLCNTSTCIASDAGIALYRDSIHFSYEGSAWLGRHSKALKLH
jgi:peptidoglycan/LPS O-acetylase OafA/YrhL